MTHAIRVHSPGGPEVLAWEPVEVGEPGPGQVRLRQTAVGVNFIDTYQRSGLYSLPLPSGLGSEAAGVVEAVGEGVSEVAVGDRVAYGSGAPVGAYAEARVVPVAGLVKLPDGVADETAAAMMLKGLTAEYLLRRTYRVKAGDVIVITAAAGGVGLIACQWARALGATVVGTVGSEAKAELAHAHGCSHPVVTGKEDLVARVQELTDGRGAPVVYDSVGKDSFATSMKCLAPRGLLVSFGQSSGLVPPLDIRALSDAGSLYLTRPTLKTYVATRADLVAAAAALFDVVEQGSVRIQVNHRYPLREVAAAHRDLEARKTTGSVVLVP
jgi:NADPH2:quinone reductase